MVPEPFGDFMAAYQDLFESSLDWLSHTLANPSEHLSNTKIILSDGTCVSRESVGVLRCTPPVERTNPNQEALIVSAGIHGNETAPIEVLNALVSELLTGEWQLACPLLLILGNPPAMAAGERFLKANLNRLFSGAHCKPEYVGLPEAARARFLEEACSEFAGAHPQALSHYDLHTAIRPSQREKFALYPFVEGRQMPDTQGDFLLEAEVDTLLLQHKAGTTFASFSSSALDAESFTVELGKVRPFGENDLARFDGIKKALRRRFCGESGPVEQQPLSQLAVFEVVHEILNTGKNFQFHIPGNVANFTEYPPGTIIWEDDDTCYRVEHSPQAIVFPNRDVPVGQRVGLMIKPQ